MLDLVEECVSGSPWDREDSVGADDADAVEALGHEQILTALGRLLTQRPEVCAASSAGAAISVALHPRDNLRLEPVEVSGRDRH